MNGQGMIPNEYFEGGKWQKLPSGFIPVDGEYSAVGFMKTGESFTMVGNSGCTWPQKFKDYDYEIHKDRREAWIQDSHSRWSQNFKVRSKHCPKGKASGGCGFELDLVLELQRVEKDENHATSLRGRTSFDRRGLLQWGKTSGGCGA